MSSVHMSVRLYLCGLRVLEVSVDAPDAPGGGCRVVCVAGAVRALRVLVSSCARSAGEEDSRSVGVGSVCDAALAAAPVRLGGLRRAPLGGPPRVRREADQASGAAAWWSTPSR